VEAIGRKYKRKGETWPWKKTVISFFTAKVRWNLCVACCCKSLSKFLILKRKVSFFWLMGILHNLQSGGWLAPFIGSVCSDVDGNIDQLRDPPHGVRQPVTVNPPLPFRPHSFSLPGRTLLSYVTPWSWLMSILPAAWATPIAPSGFGRFRCAPQVHRSRVSRNTASFLGLKWICNA